MPPKPGHGGYLLLGGAFAEPRWRQALVLQVDGDWMKTIVRCSREEITSTGFTPLSVEESTFCIV